MWNVKAKWIPVIEGAIGTISKSLRQYLSKVPGKREIKELQKAATLDTAHVLSIGTNWTLHTLILREVLM